MTSTVKPGARAQKILKDNISQIRYWYVMRGNVCGVLLRQVDLFMMLFLYSVGAPSLAFYIFPHTMCGFRRHLSTQGILLQFKEKVIFKAPRDHQKAIMPLDFKGAFDNVSHTPILEKLYSTAIPYTQPSSNKPSLSLYQRSTA